MPFTPEQLKAHRAKLKAEGVCVRCHKRPAESGKVICGKCSNDRNELKRELVRSGLCRDCGGPLDDPTITRCVNCKDNEVYNQTLRRMRNWG